MSSLRAGSTETSQVAALLDRMLDGCALYEPVREGGRIVDFERIHLNPAGIRRMASQGIDVRITSLREALPGIERQGVFRRYVDVVETQRPWSGDDVTYRDGRVSGIYDIQAWPVGEGFAVTWREVTDRERVLEALRLSEQRFRATVDHLPDAVSVFESVRDRNGRIADFRWVYCNGYNAEMTGYPVERLLGSRLLEVFPEQGPAGMIEIYSQVVSTGLSWEQPTVWYEDTWGDGSRRRRAFDVRASKVGDGFVVVSRDVTDVRQATETLAARERQLAEAQHLARMGSWEHDPVTGETDWSRECGDILGYAADQPPSLDALRARSHPEDAARVDAALDAALDEGGAWDLGHRLLHPDGTVRHVHARGRVELDDTGAAAYVRGTLLDETDVIRVSDALVESNLRLEESNQSLSDLLGLVGHDLKNPLTVAAGFLSMAGLELDDLEQTGVDVSGARAMLGRATEAATRVESLLASVLEMSRIDYSTLRSRGEPVDVAEVVQQAVADLTISSEVEIADLAGLRAVADASHLRQVLGNLLSNADKYGAAPITISGETVGSTTRIVVTDTGAGVPEDFLPRLFERFSRAERESKPGTGLGLHLARQLCRVMGGDLTYLPPVDGEGPRFVVSLAAG